MPTAGCGESRRVGEAVKATVRVKERIEPSPELVRKYDERYSEFKRIYPAIKDLFARRTD